MIYCVACKKDVFADLVTGEQVYPHRPDLYRLKFYKCPTCGNSVGCHRGSKKPLGVIATRELKKARIDIHDLLDPIWRTDKLLSRNKLYSRLSDKIGKPYHTAEIRSIEEARMIYKYILEIKKELSESSKRSKG